MEEKEKKEKVGKKNYKQIKKSTSSENFIGARGFKIMFFFNNINKKKCMH